MVPGYVQGGTRAGPVKCRVERAESRSFYYREYLYCADGRAGSSGLVFSLLKARLVGYSAARLMNREQGRPIEILLVEDSPSDTELTLEALRDFRVRNNVSVAEDGVLALDFLRRQGPYAQAPRPDLIMLDLNLPRKDGREVLAAIKGDERFRSIPVVVLTTSRADQDILRAYQLNANCYINKPVDFSQFLEVVRSIETFWLFVVTLPPGPGGGTA